MKKNELAEYWVRLRQRHGMLLRVVELFPEDKITAVAIPGMRTPAQQVAHLYSLLRSVAEGVVSGTIAAESEGVAFDGGIKSRADMIAFIKSSWDKASAATAKVTDANLAGPVANPWGMEMSGTIAFAILYDEFMHHRGQLYAFARAFGKEPPMMWSFANNAPEFQPKAAAGA